MANGGYRKIIILCIIVVFGVSVRMTETLLCVKAADKKTPDDLKLYAQSAVLMDGESGRVLFAKNGEVERPMASTTKIMTCILALELGKGTDVVTVSKKAAAQPEVHLGMREGDTFYLEDLLYSIMLESHNDSAWAIAEHIAGSVENFTDLMDKKAKDLGCGHTNFVTPNGLDGEDADGIHHTTAEDLARIMKYCIMDSPEKEQFLEITGTREYHFQDVEGKASYSCANHNAFLTMMNGAISGKTGFTADAGYCYVGALRRDDRTFIVALLACGWPNNKGYKWSDTRKLMEYGLSNYEYRNVWQDFPEQEIVVKDSGDDRNIYQKNTVVRAGIQKKPEALKVLLRTDENVEVSMQMENTLSAPVEKGQKIGEIRYLLDENVIAEYDVVTRSGLQKRTFSWCLKRCVERFFFCQKRNVFFMDLH